MPFESHTTPGKIDPCLRNPRHGLEAILDQPDTGSTVNSLDQEVDLADLPQRIHELLLNLIDVVKGLFFRWLWWWPQNLPLWCALVKAFQTRRMNSLTDGLTARTTEGS
jgi:hypothetical protein